MSDEIQRELQTLKDQAASLTNRIRLLEQRLTSSAGSVSSPASTLPPLKATTASQPVLKPQQTQRESFESRIGRFWLQRIGMASLVLGVAFFILYTFRYLGAGAKIAIGYAVGCGLLALGALVERRKGLAWYGRGLIGGGWAVAYFTTYAMHNIPSTRIIQDPTVSLVFLLMVTAAAIGSALRHRSQIEAIFAFLLGFLTMFVSHVTLFTLGSVVLLTAAIVIVAVRMLWPGLCLYGTVGSHLTHMILAQRLIGLNLISSEYADVAVTQFWLNAAFLILYWSAYNTAVLLLGRAENRNRRLLITATIANSLLFGMQMLTSVPHAYWDGRYLTPLCLGVAHLLLTPEARRRGLDDVAETHVLIGLGWITTSASLKLIAAWAECLWSFEMAALIWLGLRFQRKSYRLFAAVLALLLIPRMLWELTDVYRIPIFGYHVSQRLVNILTAAVSYGVAAVSYRLEQFATAQHAAERQAFHVYIILAGFFLTCVLIAEVASRWLSLTLAIEGLGILALGFLIKDRVARIGGLIIFGMLVLKILFVDLAQTETIYRILSFFVAGTVLLAASYVYARFENPKSSSKKSSA